MELDVDTMLPELMDLPVDRKSIEQSKLDIQERKRRNLLTWNGQFSPQLVHALLDCHAATGHRVLDPFAGSGTTLVECARLGLQALGTEINPAAYHMANVYSLVNSRITDRRTILNDVTDRLSDAVHQPLFSRNALSATAIQRRLVACWTESTGHTKTMLAALIVQLDFYKPGLSSERVFGAWDKLKSVALELPFSLAPIVLANSDARAIPAEDASIDLIITSPPYINVFNYHQQFRRSAEALGWDLLGVARSEIGSNRKHRSNRFLTVIQFCLDMTDVLMELKRVLSPSGKMLFVVGRESNVRKTRFLNGDIVAKLAVGCCGLTLAGRQERVYKNKFGAQIYEDILSLKPSPANRRRASCSPEDVATVVLSDAVQHAPAESLSDLKEAIASIGSIARSPMYCRTANSWQ